MQDWILVRVRIAGVWNPNLMNYVNGVPLFPILSNFFFIPFVYIIFPLFIYKIEPSPGPSYPLILWSNSTLLNMLPFPTLSVLFLAWYFLEMVLPPPQRLKAVDAEICRLPFYRTISINYPRTPKSNIFRATGSSLQSFSYFFDTNIICYSESLQMYMEPDAFHSEFSRVFPAFSL